MNQMIETFNTLITEWANPVLTHMAKTSWVIVNFGEACSLPVLISFGYNAA